MSEMTWMALTFLFVMIQGLFALFEMSALSFSRMRLQYECSLGKKRAIWLKNLLGKPSYFFGTTLIGVNAALLIGSECSRQFYESIHLDPDLAPITQIFFVVIFGELAPLFAARRHPSQIALALTPFMMVLSRLFLPLIWAFDGLSQLIHRWVGSSKSEPRFFSREEVAMAFEEREGEFNVLTKRIFELKNQTVRQIMVPLEKVVMVSSSATLSETKRLLINHYEPLVPIYRHQKHNIIAIAYTRDFFRLSENDLILPLSRMPWFVSEETSLLEIMNQFRRNNQSVAVILGHLGRAIGLLTLDQVVDQIFGKGLGFLDESPSSLYVVRTLPGETTVSAFNQEFQADIVHHQEDTLSDLIVAALSHPPVAGDFIKIEGFIFTVVEPTLRGVKTLTVRSF